MNSNFSREGRVIKLSDRVVKPQIASPDPGPTRAIEAKLAKEKKSVLVAYLLWFFLWFTGAQNFYVGRKGLAWLELILLIISLVSCVYGGSAGIEAGESMEHDLSGLGAVLGSVTYSIIPFGILFILAIFDMFTLPFAIKSHLEKRRKELLRESGLSDERF